MPPTTYAVPPIRGIAMRLTRLDVCGNPPDPGDPAAVIVTDGFISAKVTPQYEEGTETTVKNANGALAINDRAPAVLKNLDVELALIGINPDALEMLAGYEIVLDNDGNTVGVDYGEDVQANGIAVEVWTAIASVDACAGGAARYGYILLPFTSGYRVTGDITVQNDAINFTVQGVTKRGNNWDKGPFDVEMNGVAPAAVPGPLLVPMSASRHMRFITTEVPPPTVSTPAAVPMPV